MATVVINDKNAPATLGKVRANTVTKCCLVAGRFTILAYVANIGMDRSTCCAFAFLVAACTCGASLALTGMKVAGVQSEWQRMFIPVSQHSHAGIVSRLAPLKTVGLITVLRRNLNVPTGGPSAVRLVVTKDNSSLASIKMTAASGAGRSTPDDCRKLLVDTRVKNLEHLQGSNLTILTDCSTVEQALTVSLHIWSTSLFRCASAALLGPETA